MPAFFSLLALIACAVLACTGCGAQSAASEQATAASAEALAREGKTVEAQQIVSDFLQSHPQSVPVNVVAGELEAYRHEWARAMAFYEVALQASPEDEPARTGERKAATALALHLRAIQDTEGALATLQHAQRVMPDDVPTLLNVALQAQTMHRLKTADETIGQALALQPLNDRALYAAAGIAFDRSDPARAALLYRKYLEQHANDASAHYGLGRALRLQQKNEDAKRELDRSIEIQPVQTEAYFQLGEIAVAAGQDEEAKRNYRKTLSRMPTHGGALTGMGMLAYRQHDYQTAKAALEQAVASSPDYQPAHYYLGLTLRRLGDTPGAERELHTATELAAQQQGKGAPIAAQ